jgi:hypothetical protein
LSPSRSYTVRIIPIITLIDKLTRTPTIETIASENG